MNRLLAAVLCERFGHDPTRHPSGQWWCRRCNKALPDQEPTR